MGTMDLEQILERVEKAGSPSLIHVLYVREGWSSAARACSREENLSSRDKWYQS